jgi:hypothetical protein
MRNRRPAIQGRRAGEWHGKQSHEMTLRDRLTGRTPRSDRGDRGSTPCPGTRWAGSAIWREHLFHTQEAAGSSPASPTHRRGASQVRSLPVTPLGSVAQSAELPALTRGRAGSTPAGATLEGLPQARYPVSKTGGLSGLGGSTPSPSVSDPAWSSRQDARLLLARGRFEPCRRSCMPPWSNGR